MSRILTITANTAIDYCIKVEQLIAGNNIVAKSSVEYAAGKGINVAKAIESLQCQVTAMGFVGSQSLNVFDAIKSKLLQTDFTLVEGKTRSNITLTDVSHHQETHIRTTGFCATTTDCNRLMEKFEACVSAGDVVVLSGSLPPGTPKNLYQTLIALCHDKAALPFLDSSGATLVQSLPAKPYLIKPNLMELEEIMGRTLSDEKAIVAAAQHLINLGAQRVVVSRGKQGIIIVTDNKEALAAEVEYLSKNVISTIGCGDALVAGLAVATLRKYPLPNVIKFSIASATANLFSNEPGRFDPLLAETLQRQITIRSL